MLVVDRPRSDVKPSLLHFTFWIYRNKSTNRTGHKTIIVVVKTFRSVVMQNILIRIHHQIFWLPWIILLDCHFTYNRMETSEVDELLSIFNVSASGQLSKVGMESDEYMPIYVSLYFPGWVCVLLVWLDQEGRSPQLRPGGSGRPEWLHLRQSRHHQLPRWPERGGCEWSIFFERFLLVSSSYSRFMGTDMANDIDSLAVTPIWNTIFQFCQFSLNKTWISWLIIISITPGRGSDQQFDRHRALWHALLQPGLAPQWPRVLHWQHPPKGAPSRQQGPGPHQGRALPNCRVLGSS